MNSNDIHFVLVSILDYFFSKEGNMACITQYVESMPSSCLSQFSKVILYDDEAGNFFKTACKNHDCSYVGLVTELVNMPVHDGEERDLPIEVLKPWLRIGHFKVDGMISNL